MLTFILVYALIILLLFLFQPFGDHRFLHSFPTRRSSDLPQMQFLDGRLTWASSNPLRCFTTPSEWIGTDRKSTRLNSSHRTISYAVFCLKKKKVHEQWPAQDRCTCILTTYTKHL